MRSPLCEAGHTIDPSFIRAADRFSIPYLESCGAPHATTLTQAVKAAMPEIRLLHLSDIHFSHAVGHDRVEHDDVRRKVIEDARDELAARYGAVSGIIVAGDIAYAGKATEYRQAAAWLEELASSVGCPITSVHTVPGNHDVNLDRVTAITQHLHRHYRGLPQRQLKQELEQLAAAGTEGFLVEKLRDYHDFASAYGCDFVSPARPLWSNYVPLGPGRRLRLVGLTSVQVSDLEDTKNGLVLGANQYIIDEEDCVEQVVIMHHPYDWLKDGREAEPYINNRARIIIAGHEHLARIEKITNEADCDRLFIESGAVTPPDAQAPYIYHYNLLAIDLGGNSGDHHLKVRVYPRVWSLQRTRFVADTGRLVTRDFADYTLRCPRYNHRTCAEAREDPPGDSALSAGFTVLRYIFWRYLDWSQRMEALVAVNALPGREADPLPQNVERLALRRAREQGRLADLWDKSMPFVPENKRQRNPF